MLLVVLDLMCGGRTRSAAGLGR